MSIAKIVAMKVRLGQISLDHFPCESSLDEALGQAVEDRCQDGIPREHGSNLQPSNHDWNRVDLAKIV